MLANVGHAFDSLMILEVDPDLQTDLQKSPVVKKAVSNCKN